jgi:hypothetical protein
MGSPTMTLATYNRYVDSATDASKIERWSEQHGSLVVGDQVLYWKEELKRKPFRAKGRHRKQNPRGGVFFLGRFRIPRKPAKVRTWFRLFGGWR